MPSAHDDKFQLSDSLSQFSKLTYQEMHPNILVFVTLRGVVASFSNNSKLNKIGEVTGHAFCILFFFVPSSTYSNYIMNDCHLVMRSGAF